MAFGLDVCLEATKKIGSIFNQQGKESIVKKNSIALLEDSYISPLLINTLIRERVPAHAQSNRLKEELGRYYPDLILLDEDEAANVLAESGSLVCANSDLALLTMRDILTGPFEVDVIDSLKDKSVSGIYLSKALTDSDKRGDKRVDEKARIQNKDFACDAYINVDGEPVVLGIYEHPVLDKNDSRDIVYFTSSEVMKKMLPRMKDALRKMSSSQLDLRNLPLHAKFRLQKNHLLIIEVKLRRFGSFSLSDLLFFAFGMNPYKQYFRGLKPDWASALSLAGDDIFFRVLSRLTAAVPADRKPDHIEYADTFQNIVGYCKLDPNRYPAFSIAFARTDNLEDVRKYLSMNFGDFLT